jgi:Na+-transporting NADH:ubiquinone oxidoreductase subunit B
MHPLFVKGGRFEKYYAVYEMVDTFLYTPPDVTHHCPHVRDAIDLKRVMSYVVVATLPCILMALYNTGYQANLAMAEMGITVNEGWRGGILNSIGYDPSSMFDCMVHGLLYFLPI